MRADKIGPGGVDPRDPNDPVLRDPALREAADPVLVPVETESREAHECPFGGTIPEHDWPCGEQGWLCDRCKEDMANDRAALIAGGNALEELAFRYIDELTDMVKLHTRDIAALEAKLANQL